MRCFIRYKDTARDLRCFSRMLISNVHKSIIVMNSLDTRFSKNVFEAVQKTRSTCFIGSKTTRLRLVVLNPIKHSCSFFKHYIKHWKISFLSMHRWSVSSLAALTPKLFWMSIWECIKSETHYIIRSYTRSLRSRWLSKPQIKSLVDWAKIKWFAPFFTSAQTGVHFIKMYTSPWKGCDKRRLRGRGSEACKRNQK